MRDNFEFAFEKLIGHEGGFTDDRHDRGNWTSGVIGKGELKGTKYGVSAMSYPKEDIKGLTLEKAREIYKRDYWDAVKGDELPSGIDYLAFDIAVNHGTFDGAAFVQRAAGVTADGKIGPQSLAAIAKKDPTALANEVCVVRGLDYASISTFSRYGKGWFRRLMESHATALEMIKKPAKAEPKAETIFGFRRI